MSQPIRDALKKMRTDGEAWLTFGGERLRVVPITDDDIGGDAWSGWEVLCHTKRRKLVVGLIVSRKNTAFRPHMIEPFSVWLNWKDVLARVVEHHPRAT